MCNTMDQGISFAARLSGAGVEPERIVVGFRERMQARLEQAVAAGRISQRRADVMLQQGVARIEHLLESCPNKSATKS